MTYSQVSVDIANMCLGTASWSNHKASICCNKSRSLISAYHVKARPILGQMASKRLMILIYYISHLCLELGGCVGSCFDDLILIILTHFVSILLQFVGVFHLDSLQCNLIKRAWLIVSLQNKQTWW